MSRRILLYALTIVAFAACSSTQRLGASGQNRPAALEIAVPIALAARDAELSALLAPRQEAFAREDGARIVSEGWRNTKYKRWSDLGVRLPDTANEAYEVGVSQFERLRLEVTLIGATPVKGAIDGGRVVYAGALHDVDRVFGADASRLEELLVLRSSEAPHEFTWRVGLPADITSVSAESTGLAFRGVSGHTELRMPWPYALDALGKKKPVQLDWDANTHELRASIDRAGLVYPVVIDPRFETGVWYAPSIFSYRQAHAMAFDAARGNIVLFGGGSSTGGLSTAFGDTWTWNGSTWTQMFPAQSPMPRFSHAMTYDAARNVVVLFGGYGGATRYDDTWTWDGTTWTKATTPVSPPGRLSHAMTFDAARGNVVMFGGESAAKFSDTWTWNGSTWTQSMGASPPARTSHAMTYDAVRSNVVLFGGAGASAALNDTWTWNGASWTQSAGASPPARSGHGLAFDVARGNVVMFGGLNVTNDTWTWNGTAWTQRSTGTLPFARQNFSMAYDAIRQRVVVSAGYSLAAGGGSFRDTWLWDGTAWAQTAPPPTPSTRYLHAMAYDAARGNVVLFGGYGGSMYLGDTWIWNGATWTLGTPTVSPPAMLLSAMAFDAARGNVVLFGGSNGAARGQTYTWDGTNWTLLAPSPAPAARSGHTMEYDAERQNVVLFGGGGAGAGYLGDTWTWNGSAWTSRVAAQSPPARDLGAMAYDSVRKNVVLFGGRNTSSPGLDDTWTWNGTTWSEVISAMLPVRRSLTAMTFDSRRGSLVLFGGLDQGGATLGDTWFWNGATWTPGTTTQPPAPRFGAHMAYDAVRGNAVLFGGNSTGATSLNDTWLLYPLGSSCSQNADCPSASCVDGVCCNAAQCGTCETCAGTSPGQCAPIQNDEDFDSCPLASGKSCSRVGECKLALGSQAATASECASGFVVDGVCCDTKCDGNCQACRADLKESGQRSGVCDHARTGLDPHETCAENDASSCQQDGTCDGRGKCRLFTNGTACGDVACVDNRATGRLCNGLGSCGESAAGVTCGIYKCLDTRGCLSSCTSDGDCNARSHCEGARCVANEGASCDGDHTVTSPEGATQDCGKYKCEGAVCKTRCTSVVDCVSPAECTPEGTCVSFSAPTPEEPGCSVHAREATDPTRGVWALAVGFASLRSARRRFKPSERARTRVGRGPACP